MNALLAIDSAVQAERRLTLREIDELHRARAAIAELIDATDKLQRAYHLMNTDPDFVRLRVALARVGGAK